MIVAIVQARLGSKRLPRKVLADIAGKPMLERVLERAKAIKGVASVILAVPRTDPELASFWSGPTFVGSPMDVLDRVFQPALSWGASAVLRITGDCPLLAPEFSSRVVAAYREMGAPLCSNVGEWTDGLDTEVVSMKALEAAWREAEDPSELEHVTAFLRNRPERFAEHYVAQPDWWPGPKLSVDERKDLDFVRHIYAHLRDPSDFSLQATYRAIQLAESCRGCDAST